MESIMEVPQNTKTITTMQSSNITPTWYFLKEIPPKFLLEVVYSKRIYSMTHRAICIPMFIAALFTIVKL
jgi:hypothetical protein